MASIDLARPEPTEVEVSIFGPGYGESVLVHVGDGNWVLVDSCINPNSRKPASLQYLEELGVNANQSVRLIVATHWHDDHVRGLSTIFKECPSALFSLPPVLLGDDFITLAKLCGASAIAKNSGLYEFAEVFKELARNKDRLCYAVPDRRLLQLNVGSVLPNVNATVYSLSPSDAAMFQATLAFSNLLVVKGSQKRIRPPKRNDTSVALWVQVGTHTVLLGADLEADHDSAMGWSAILDRSTVIPGKAGVFKLPHHGAQSAHEPRVWSSLLTDGPYAILTPWRNGGHVLPTLEDMSRIRGQTPNAYMTAATTSRQHKWRNKIVREEIGAVTRYMHNVHTGWGHVRLRTNISDASSGWSVALSGDAAQIGVFINAS